MFPNVLRAHGGFETMGTNHRLTQCHIAEHLNHHVNSCYLNVTNCRLPNMPSTTNPKYKEIVDAPGNDGNMSMPEQVKRPNPWRKMMMIECYTDTTFIHCISKL